MAFKIERCKVICETNKAIRIKSDTLAELAGEDEDWIPKSQIDDDSEVFANGTEGDLIVSDWFANQKGWD